MPRAAGANRPRAIAPPHRNANPSRRSTDRWGIEAIANLAQVPEQGATVIIAVAKIEGATGVPPRVIALV